MKKKLIVGLLMLGVGLVMVPMFAAFEAHVINVTAQIENALQVHPESQNFGTVFPQEKLLRSIFVAVSTSFSTTDQRRVLSVDYVIKQKPKPRDVADADYCHTNSPEDPGDPQDPYYAKCYPVLCKYLSKLPDNFPPPGNDTGLAAYHQLSEFASGTLNKDTDPGDQWLIDLDTPCFDGQCAQDWTHQGWELPAGLDGQMFGCDLWVEVTNIY